VYSQISDVRCGLKAATPCCPPSAGNSGSQSKPATRCVTSKIAITGTDIVRAIVPGSPLTRLKTC
jgi:hypothetical protein